MPVSYVKDSLVRVSATFTNLAGAPVDPTAVSLTVIDGAGATTTPAAAKDSTGNYHADLNVAVSGVWYFKFKGTGANQGAAEGSFDVPAGKF